MAMLTKTLVVVAATGVLTMSAFALSAKEVRSFSPLVAIEHGPAPKLIVDAPLPGPLARGAVVIPCRLENLRLLPVLGAAAVNLSPRIGHLHVTVDDLPWHWVDFGDSKTIVVAFMPPGPHKVLIEVADVEHRVLTAQTVTFTVPEPAK